MSENIVSKLKERVNELERQVENLLKNQETTQAILEAMPDSIFILDNKYVFRCYYTQKVEELYAPPDFFINKKINEVLPAELSALTMESIDNVLRSKQIHSYEYSLEMKGEIRFYEARMVPKGDKEVLTIVREITERKNYEKEILRLATVVEQASQVIVIFDSEGNIEYVNPAFEKSTGYTFAEAKGQNWRILKICELDAHVYEELWDTISSGKVWHGIFHNKKKDGTMFYEKATIFPIKNTEGQIVNYAAVKQDITIEKKLETQLRQSVKMESIGNLAGGGNDNRKMTTCANPNLTTLSFG
ncbi:hypothetical protein GF1_12360 [Desulfolithobacter dissulfuricans]|uniref:PAS domain S-box protein n=1 Tax=Desulfolithobacter dissulfuricans TaxID=2795293 RepID=A0A915XI71_9BACT|nr:PAS domain-containing protein [Desulfolithobacter dissulfuricans]BCO08860.1 hypothetical protein GF1_12360 [Desulfolithobacter dissulfuricans]